MSRAKILAPFLLDLVGFWEAFTTFTSTFEVFEK